jgi:hypothetical protein
MVVAAYPQAVSRLRGNPGRSGPVQQDPATCFVDHIHKLISQWARARRRAGPGRTGRLANGLIAAIQGGMCR